MFPQARAAIKYLVADAQKGNKKLRMMVRQKQGQNDF